MFDTRKVKLSFCDQAPSFVLCILTTRFHRKLVNFSSVGEGKKTVGIDLDLCD